MRINWVSQSMRHIIAKIFFNEVEIILVIVIAHGNTLLLVANLLKFLTSRNLRIP